MIRSPLGVAETGAVWLTEVDLAVSALGVSSRHFVVLLDPAAIVPTMHDAYARSFLAGSPYGVFMGTRGARSLTVLLSPERTP